MADDSQDKAETDIELSLDLLKLILNAVPDPLFIKDSNHRWIFANLSFSRIVGRPVSECIHKCDYDLFPTEIADKFIKQDEEIFKSGGPHQSEEKITSASGQEIFLEITKTPMHTPAGQILLGAIRDVTEERDNNQRLLFSARLATFGEIASGLAHDLNNPLSILKGRAQQISRLAASDALSMEEALKIAASIENACNRAQGVLTELSRLGVACSVRIQNEFSAEGILSSLAAMFKTRLESLGVEYSTESPEGGTTIYGVEEEIRQVFISLTQYSFNSIYNESTPFISWMVDQAGDYTRVRIFDSGSTSHSKEFLQSKFSSSAKSTQFALGFTVVKSIVLANRGFIKPGDEKVDWRFEILLPSRKCNEERKVA